MALMDNPDPSRRQDCLRQLVVVLSERGQLQDLVEFDYDDLEEEVGTYVQTGVFSGGWVLGSEG